MDLTFSRPDILDALDRVGGAVPNKSPRPVLQNVLIESAPDGTVSLTGTDLEIVAVATCTAEVRTPGRLLVPYARLRTILRAVSGGSVTIATAPEGLEITAGFGRWTLPAEDPDTFPAVDLDAKFAAASGAWRIAPADLARALDACAPATDVNSTRFALGGIKVESADGTRGLTFIATDGRRLHRVETAAEPDGEPVQPTSGGILPTRAAALVSGACRNAADPTVDLVVGADAILCWGQSWSYSARCVEGRYPRWQDVLPDDPPATTLAFGSADDLAGMVAQAAVMTSEESRAITFEADGTGMTLSARAADVGKSRIDGEPARIDGEPGWCDLDPRYVASALKAIGNSGVAVELHGPKAPVVFRSTADDFAFFAVVMPLERSSDNGSGLHRPGVRAAAQTAYERAKAKPEPVEV